MGPLFLLSCASVDDTATDTGTPAAPTHSPGSSTQHLREWYRDADQDGFGGQTIFLAAEQPEGHVPVGGDCNDGDSSVSPAALEECDGVDNNCDGDVDEGCRLLGERSVESAYSKVFADDAEHPLGGYIERTSDVTGDGRADLIIRTRNESSSLVSLLSGGTQEYVDLEVPWTNQEVFPLDADIDGDGFTDLGYTVYSNYKEAGVGFWHGPVTALGAPDWTFTGEALKGTSLGCGLAFHVGDMDADGTEDLGILCDRREVLILDGPVTESRQVLLGSIRAHETFWDLLGSDTIRANDLNGNGLPDLVVSGNQNTDYKGVGVFHDGVSTGLLMGSGLYHSGIGDETLRLFQDDQGVYAGLNNRVDDDLTGNGIADLVTSDPRYDGYITRRGRVYVIDGTLEGTSTLTDAATAMVIASTDDNELGHCFSTGDLDGDGQADLVVNDVDTYENTAIRVYYGPISGSLGSTDADFSATSSDYDLLCANALVDVTGDQIADLVIGSEYDDHGGEDAGAIWLFAGAQ